MAGKNSLQRLLHAYKRLTISNIQSNIYMCPPLQIIVTKLNQDDLSHKFFSNINDCRIEESRGPVLHSTHFTYTIYSVWKPFQRKYMRILNGCDTQIHDELIQINYIQAKKKKKKSIIFSFFFFHSSLSFNQNNDK